MRALRRAHRRRKLENAKWWYRFKGRRNERASISKTVEHPQMCSGPCCGNQRKHQGPSISERRMAARGAEEYE